MLCTFGAWLSAFLFVKNIRSYDIADVAKLSFLARTRNLMIMPVGCVFLFVAGICAVIEIRSLVLARDDGIAGTCVFFDLSRAFVVFCV
mgnify:CR=1 FL=1